eukprot:CAMPEP_0197197596 /NCGR_PEP_ID=MMETSP1423-20130617/32948_1 /TAXON_ID=476441 /ORGANISM="Pseudo-nitzschia heimii, Strain UNC1101" /LENGTH=674 /DNA_ID=CAMNT_0042651421 /DNA_START=94 /DNA_END=2118 /DNA_ORIENTATION=-
MSLPGKSTRPLKKRRFVSIEDDDVSICEQKQQQQQQELKPKIEGAQGNRKKARKIQKSTKKKNNGIVSPSPPSSPVTVAKKSVTWNVRDGNMVHNQTDISRTYPHYNENDVWYTRQDYKEFLHDRLQTIDSHRYMAANNIKIDDSYCLRGLESIGDETTSENFLSKKKLYYSTIKMEQIRQGMLGIKDPDRFRMLVEAQSNLDLHRAQELAGQDMREVLPFLSQKTDFKPRDEYQSENQNSLQKTSVSSFSDMERLRNMMESIYGSPPSSSDSSSNRENNLSPNPFFKNNAESSMNVVQKMSGASVVSDGSSNDSSSSSESPSIGQTLFSNKSIRELQQRSMRRLMGIYQNNDGEGTEGARETNSIFKFARRDSLLGIGKDPASRKNANDSNKNSLWGVAEDTAPSAKEQTMALLQRQQQEQQDHHHQQQQQQTASSDNATSILQKRVNELMHHRQLLEYQRQQAEQQHQQVQTNSTDDANTILRERITELMHQRKQLYDNHHDNHQQQQQQQQQQVESSENAIPSLQDQIKGLMHRRKLLEDHIHHQQRQQQQQQQKASSDDASSSLVEHMIEVIERRKLQRENHLERASPVTGTIGPRFGTDDNGNSSRMIEEFLIQQQQRQEEHQKRMQLAMMAMNTTPFPIRRDTLSHVRTDNADQSHQDSLPWNVTGMA